MPPPKRRSWESARQLDAAPERRVLVQHRSELRRPEFDLWVVGFAIAPHVGTSLGEPPLVKGRDQESPPKPPFRFITLAWNNFEREMLKKLIPGTSRLFLRSFRFEELVLELTPIEVVESVDQA